MSFQAVKVGFSKDAVDMMVEVISFAQWEGSLLPKLPRGAGATEILLDTLSILLYRLVEGAGTHLLLWIANATAVTTGRLEEKRTKNL